MNWKTLVQIGLIGTNHSKISEEMIRELQAIGIEEEDPARLMMKAAAIMSMKKKAGTRPADFTGDLPLATQKAQTNICSKRAVQYLNMILKRNDLSILSEFLITLKKYHKSLPPEALPLILDKATKMPVVWQALQPALGDRGRWLMQQNSEWIALDYVPTLEDWENGNTQQRASYLRHLRAVEPLHALRLLEETWEQESTVTRKKLLNTLQIGLSKTDDSFLSRHLATKQKNTQETAASLLSLIPDSTYNQRMLIRLKKLIKIKKSGNQLALEISLPKGVDDTMILDGIKASAKLYRSGNKASQLAQMINRLPLNYWSDLTGLSAPELLPLFTEHEYGYLLLNAISDAATHHQDQLWSQLILQTWISKTNEKLWQDFAPLRLIPVIDKSQYNQLALSGFKELKYLPAENTPLDFLLQRGAHDWEEDLSLTFFDHLKSWLKSTDATHWGDWHIRKILSIAGLRTPADLYPKISRDWPEHLPVWGGWERDVLGSLTKLELRYKMVKALRKD